MRKRFTEPSDHDVRQEAYLLWEQSGKPDNLSDLFWFLAQRKLRANPAASDLDEVKYSMVMELIRESGRDAYINQAIRNLAASVGINMDRL